MLGTMKTRISLTLDKSLATWSGSFSFDAISPSGEVIRSDEGTLEASRISVELS
jgi:hypothetical protein